jgi:hypothetical protein
VGRFDVPDTKAFLVINFRYHLVSVTAVFLALAIGLVLGTSALNGPSMDFLSDQVTSLRNDNEQLRDQVGQLEDDASKDQTFATEVAPATLSGTLKGEQVLIMSIGTVDPADVEGVVTMLGYSDATAAGQLTFTDAFSDPANAGKLTDLVAELTPKNFEPPNNNDGMESAAALLAAALLADGPVSNDDRDSIVQALQDLKMVSVDQKPAKPATVVVLVTGEPYSDTDAAERNTNVLTFVDQFGRQGPTVVSAATIVGGGNVINAVVSDEGLAEDISTVDNVSRPEGQLATILAASERLDGNVGHYGTGDEATALVPESP